MRWMWIGCLMLGGLATAQSGPGAENDAALQAVAQQAEAASAANQPQRALALLRPAVVKHPHWRAGWWQLGSLLYSQNDFLNAGAAFQHLSQLDPAAGGVWVMLGLCEFEEADYGQSLQHLERGRALGFPKNPELTDAALYHQALGLILEGDYEQAQLLLDGFSREDHRSPEVIEAQGLAALRRPMLPSAARRVLPADEWAVLQALGEAQYLAAQRHIDEARTIYEAQLAAHPQMRGLHYATGILLGRMGAVNRARAAFTAELVVDPESEAARLQLANMELKLGTPQAGLPFARAAVRLAPRDFVPHYVLGNILARLGQTAEAARELEMSRDLQPESSEVRYALAQLYTRLGRSKEAAEERAAFLQLKPIEDAMKYSGKVPASLYRPEGPVK